MYICYVLFSKQSNNAIWCILPGCFGGRIVPGSDCGRADVFGSAVGWMLIELSPCTTTCRHDGQQGR